VNPATKYSFIRIFLTVILYKGLLPATGKVSPQGWTIRFLALCKVGFVSGLYVPGHVLKIA
jgi:hypothetical protein